MGSGVWEEHLWKSTTSPFGLSTARSENSIQQSKKHSFDATKDVWPAEKRARFTKTKRRNVLHLDPCHAVKSGRRSKNSISQRSLPTVTIEHHPASATHCERSCGAWGIPPSQGCSHTAHYFK